MNVHQMKTALLNAPEFIETANMLATVSGARCITEREAQNVAEWAARNCSKPTFQTLLQNIALMAAGVETILPLGVNRPNYEVLWYGVWSTFLPYPVWLSIHAVIVLETIAVRDQMHRVQQAKTATIQ